MEIKRQIIQGTSSVCLRRKAIKQNLNLKNLLKAARAMETPEEQTSEIEKQQSHAVGSGRKRTNDTQQKESSSGNQSLVFITLNVVCVVESIHIKVSVLRKVNNVLTVAKLITSLKFVAVNPTIAQNPPVQERHRKVATVPDL